MSDLDLSPSGQARRDHILELAIRQARRQRRRRQAIRVGILGFVLVGVGVALLHTLPAPLNQPGTSTAKVSPPGISPVDRPRPTKVVIERVQTDPLIVRRLAVPPVVLKCERIDDDQLLQALAEAGKPAGLLRMNGQVTLLFRRPAR